MSDEGEAGPANRGGWASSLIAHRFALVCAVAIAFALTSWLGFFFFRDNFSTHFPAKVISAQAWRAGSVPWWNDADAGGQPLAGNPNTLTFYPDNFLYLILPAHVAFNLHFLLHLAIGWLAMRALTRGSFGAWLWVLSGAAMSTLGFYNLVVAFAMIPLAFLAIERRSTAMLALSFGLMMLAGEPVVIAASALGCAILAAGRMPIARIAIAVVAAFAIASPQLIAYSEIAAEIERARGFSAQTALNASFDPRRLIEILIGPFARVGDSHLFPTLFIGVIVIPALFARSRYVAIAATTLFFALGRFNPLVRAAVEALPSRSARYPEKFALPMCAALVVLAAAYSARSRQRRLWTVITFVPLIAWAVATVPVDWWAPYALAPQPAQRVYVAPLAGGQDLDRDDFHRRAERREPLFGATAGMRYVLNRSGDGMHSVLSRIAAERWASTRNSNWLRIATAPEMLAVPHAAAAPSVGDAVNVIEAGETHVAPREVSSAIAINQTYFRAWVVRDGDRELPTFPIDLDRLGVVAPPDAKLTLTFGRHRTAVVIAWVISSLLIVALLIALRVEKLDRRAGKI
jgi:hypothetical protein